MRVFVMVWNIDGRNVRIWQFLWYNGKPLIHLCQVDSCNTVGIKHGFSCINFRQVPLDVLKTEAEGEDLANVNALKNHVRSLLLRKN